MGTRVLQSVVSERDEVSSTNQRCPSVVLHLSFWSAQRPDFVKVMVPGVAPNHAVLVSLIMYIHVMTRENMESIMKMKNHFFCGILAARNYLENLGRAGCCLKFLGTVKTKPKF